MRFGISATSLMCPKNLRTRLRPVNVCCAIVASHCVARRGEPSETAAATAFRVEFRSISKAESAEHGTETSQICSSDHQNAKRRARRENAPARQNHHVTDCKSPKLPISRRFTDGDATPPPNRLFVLSTQYGPTIPEIRGGSPSISTLFCVRPA